MSLSYVSTLLSLLFLTFVFSAAATPNLRHGGGHAHLLPQDDAAAVPSLNRASDLSRKERPVRDVEELVPASPDLKSASHIAVDAIVGLVCGYFTDVALVAALLAALGGLRKFVVEAKTDASSNGVVQYSKLEAQETPDDLTAPPAAVLEPQSFAEPTRSPMTRTRVLDEANVERPASPQQPQKLPQAPAPPAVSCEMFSIADSDSDRDDATQSTQDGGCEVFTIADSDSDQDTKIEQELGDCQEDWDLEERVHQDLETTQKQLSEKLGEGVELLEKIAKISSMRFALQKLQEQIPERRISDDGQVYTRKEFTIHFGLGEGVIRWVQAPILKPYTNAQKAAAVRIQAQQRGIAAREVYKRMLAKKAMQAKRQAAAQAAGAANTQKTAAMQPIVAPTPVLKGASLRNAKKDEFKKKLAAAKAAKGKSGGN